MFAFLYFLSGFCVGTALYTCIWYIPFQLRWHKLKNELGVIITLLEEAQELIEKEDAEPILSPIQFGREGS